MGKIVYKQYKICLHKKNYEILIPDIIPQNLWLDPRGYLYQNADSSDLFGDRDAMKCLRNVFITLAQEPDKIVYLPLENRCMAHDRILTDKVPQVVFYNHTIQLKRREWHDILKIIHGGCRKPEQYVVHYNFPELENRYETLLHQWKKSKTYYVKDLTKEYYQYNTVFFECDRKNDLRTAVKMGWDLEKDLEHEAERYGYDIPIWTGPYTNSWGYLTFYFVTERFVKQYIQ